MTGPTGTAASAVAEGRVTLRRRTGQVLGAMVGLVVVLAAVLFGALADVSAKGDQVINHWSPAYGRSVGLLADLVNQETGVRGYALSSRPQFLQPYHHYLAQERRDEAALRALIGNRADLQAALDGFVARADDWRAHIAEPFIARVRAGDPTVGDAVVNARAKAAFDRLRSASHALSDRIAAVRDQASHARVTALHLLWIAGGVGFVVLLAAFPLVWRGLRQAVLRPVERLAGQAREVAAGDLERSIRPSGPAEVYRLGEDVDRMRAQLATELAKVERARQVAITRGEELARSNADLEQFAYVASHDLSEPLRKVANFCQLLERQYSPQLDDKARQYIGFAVDGAKRMQVLIADLLAFSRVGRTVDSFAPVDAGTALDQALANLEDRIEVSGAVIERDPLPVVIGDLSLLTALFQNLVGNALKYRDESRPPHVAIRCRSVEGEWQISVSDNGIGIEPQYAERIFVIFQRLHLRDQYGGTGIGLALCRRIVEFHGGRIWLAEAEAGSGPGATFVLTLPERRDPATTTDVPSA